MTLHASALIRQAEAATGLSDWGGEPFHEGPFRRLLDALVQSLSTEAELTDHGMAAAHARLTAVLEARLEFIEDRRLHPAIGAQKIVAPVIITGLPRSGTTFLHSLLAQDPRNHGPRTFEMMFPRSHSDPERDAALVARTGEIFDGLGLLAPAVRSLHPFGPTAPEEDHLMQEIILLGDQFPAFWRAPSYMKARAELPHDIGWSVHQQVLQTLQWSASGKRMLLKHPGHLFDIPGLLRAYPDARIIQTHRDPAKVMPSVSALVGALRSAGSRSAPDPAKIARGNLQAFRHGLAALIDLREDPDVDRHFVDLQFRDLIADPIGAAARLYAAIGISFPAEARSAMQAWLDDPANKTPKGKHRLADFGLDRAAVDEAFARYRERFNVPMELE